MTPFHAAQAADPLDPVPMLILADWLEERGDLAGAAVLRGLVEAGLPSLVALAGAACWLSAARRPDGDPSSGFGGGDGHANFSGRVGGTGEGDRSYIIFSANEYGTGYGDFWALSFGGSDEENDRDNQ